LDWTADDSSAPFWIDKATQGADFALLQLPIPDKRWVVKFAGRILKPFKNRLEGWTDLYELMSFGYLRDQSELAAMFTGVADSKQQPGDILSKAELLRTVFGRNNEKSDVVHYSVTGARLKAPNANADDGPDQWKTCADDCTRQVRERLNRVLDEITEQDRLAAEIIKRGIHFKAGQFSFSDSAPWVTSIGDLSYDAAMVLRGKHWEIIFPDSAEPLRIRMV